MSGVRLSHQTGMGPQDRLRKKQQVGEPVTVKIAKQKTGEKEVHLIPEHRYSRSLFSNCCQGNLGTLKMNGW